MAAVHDFGLAPILDKSPDEISYGQRRLVAIARAVAAEPSVLLLDEPVAGLTEHESGEFAHLVRRLADTWGMAVLVIEHDMNFVMSICDRITVIDFGKFVCEGSPAEVRTHPGAIAAYLGDEPEADEPEADEPRVSAAAQRPSVEGGAGVTTPALLEARGLHCGYGAVEIVRDLMLEVRSGEVVALLGANGAGKTTTLLTLAGELKPLGGEVLFEGTKWTAASVQTSSPGNGIRHRRALGLPQPHDEAEPRGREGRRGSGAALFPELTPLMSRRAGLLSGGEQQMLTLGRALARRPTYCSRTSCRSGWHRRPSLGCSGQSVPRLMPASGPCSSSSTFTGCSTLPTASTCSTRAGSSSLGRVRKHVATSMRSRRHT